MLSGAVGGLVMASYLMAIMGLTGRGFFTPVNLLAAIFPPFRPVLSGFQPAAAAIGLALHLLVAMAWGLALGWLNRRFWPKLFNGTWSQLSVGLALGFVAWAVTGVRMGPAIDPALDALPASHAFIAHLVYGIATATVLWAWAGQVSALETPAAAGPRERLNGLSLPSH
jgi:hypothetical protein